jgi:membrane-associated phospholipid phosphatase
VLRFVPVLILGLAAFLLLSACATMENGRGWGQDATLLPSGARLRSAAVESLRDPATWIPAVGAFAFWINGYDPHASHWASEHTPLFGSQERAQRYSSLLRNVTAGGALVTSLAAPSGDDPVDWTTAKFKGLAIELAAIGATSGVTNGLKGFNWRERPNGIDEESFPSGHSSSAHAFATLGVLNLESMRLTRTQRRLGAIALRTTAGLSAWARVEAGMHYPSDVLAGAAIGSFVAGFIHRAFLDADEQDRLSLFVEPADRGLVFGLTIRF